MRSEVLGLAGVDGNGQKVNFGRSAARLRTAEKAAPSCLKRQDVVNRMYPGII